MGCQGLDHVVVDPLGHVHPLDGRTDLAVVGEGVAVHAVGDLGGVDVVEQDGRVIATELEGGPLQVGRRCGCHLLAGGHRPGEADLAGDGV